MRVWHEQLIPFLCRQHLIAQWREGIGCYAILSQNKTGYQNHPQIQEFANDLEYLADVLFKTQQEMLRRGYQPKNPAFLQTKPFVIFKSPYYKPWQNLSTQLTILRQKKCPCPIDK